MERVLVLIVIALAASSAQADNIPTPRSVCVANCGSGTSSPSNNNAANAAARRAERELFRRLDRENAERRKLQAAVKARRNANSRGVDAARKKKWHKALEYLERAHAQFPGDSQISSNLAAVRGKIETNKAKVASDRAAKLAKSSPPPPPAPTTPIETPAKPIATTAIAIASLTTQPGDSRYVEVPAPVDAAGWRDLAPTLDVRATLDANRKRFHAVVPDIKEVTTGIAKSVGTQFVPGATSMMSFRDRINGAGQMKARYNQLARDLVDEATKAANQTALILGGGESDPDYDVQEAPKRMARMVNQFVADELTNVVLGKLKGWGKSISRGIVKDAVTP